MKVAYINTGTKPKKKKPEVIDLESLSRLVKELILSNRLSDARNVINRYIQTAEIANEEAQRNEMAKALRESLERDARRRAERKRNLPKGSLNKPIQD